MFKTVLKHVVCIYHYIGKNNIDSDTMYSFRLSQSKIKLPLCPGSSPKNVTSPCCDYASFAEFYVFVGVMAFLYCIGAVVLYVCFDDKYYRRYPMVRSVVSTCLVLPQLSDGPFCRKYLPGTTAAIRWSVLS